MCGCILVLLFLHHVESNVVVNPGFELASLSGKWTGNGASVELVTNDSYRGHQSIKAFNRKNTYEGPAQYVPLLPGSRYQFRAHVKQLNDVPGKLFQHYKATITFIWLDDGKPHYVSLAEKYRVQTSTGWFTLQGDVLTPTRSFKSANLFIEGPDISVDFLVDDVFLEDVWITESKVTIEKNRKSTIDFIITHDPNLSATDITVEIDHKQHTFGFGSDVQLAWIVDPSYREYQDYFYFLFNWGTIGSFEWPKTSTAKPNYNANKNAAEKLHEHGLKVRAKSLFRNPDDKTPSWLQQMDGTTLNQTVQDRIKTVTAFMTGHVDHWEVMDDTLMDHFYEGKTGDPKYLQQIYKMMHEADPSVDLFIYNYNTLVLGQDTSALEEVALDLKPYGLGGIDATAFLTSSNLETTLMKLRLDTLASSGLPLWISGLSIKEEDEDLRAEQLEKAMRLFFGHPAVVGVTIWDFWDHLNSPDSALIEGFDFKPNAAGKRYMDLVKQEWTTYASKKLSDGTTFKLDGFHGDYDVTVYYKGRPIMRKDLHLGKTDLVYELHITGDGSEITLPTTYTPPVDSTHNYHVSHKGDHLIKTEHSSATHSTLHCQTRWSHLSAVGDDKRTDVSCEGDEILTGCSSVKKDATDNWFRDGEFIVYENGRLRCRALNGFQSRQGVFAVARCCSASHFTCEYSISGFSENLWDSLIETTCRQNYLATGCSAYNWDISLHGAYPTDKINGCFAESSRSNFGVQSSSACCYTPGLTCTTVRSAPSGPEQGELATIQCDFISGEVMTSCNYYAPDGRSAGAYITGSHNVEKCVALNGSTRKSGQEGVVAVAVCCKTDHQAPVIG